MSHPPRNSGPRLADLISFTTLGAAVASMALSIEGNLRLAGALILVGYVLDAADGQAARRLGGSSQFGIQLDSLIDVIHFGAAGSILVSQHLQSSALPRWLIWLFLAGYLFSASFRLARFNLTAASSSKLETIGLTISTGGAFLTMAVLADLAYQPDLLPDWAFLVLLAITALLMASRIPFLDFRGLPQHRIAFVVTSLAGILVTIWQRIELGLLLVWSTYLAFGVVRAVLRALRRRSAPLESRPGSVDQRSSA